MRDLDQLRERSDDTAGRKLGLFALAGTLTVAAVIAFGVVAGGSPEREVPAELDPLAQLVFSGADPKAPPVAAKAPAAVALGDLSFHDTLVGDDSAPRAHARTAQPEHTSIVSRTRARAADVPANTLASGESDRLSRSAKHDPLMAQAMPERGGVVAPSGSEGAFTLQVVSYDTREVAERFANALRARGHRAFVAQAEVPGRSRSFRVRVGPFPTRRDALLYQGHFEQVERMPSILVTSPVN